MKKHANDKQHLNGRPGTSSKKLVLGKKTLQALGGTELTQTVGGRIEPTPTTDGNCP